MEIKDEETVEQRTDKAYEAAKEQVLSGSKVEVIKAKEEASMASEPAGLASAYTGQGHHPANTHPGRDTSIHKGTPMSEIAITNQPAQPLMEKSTSTAITRTRKTANTTSAKAVDAASIVEKMKEQIACIEYIAGVEVPVYGRCSNNLQMI